MPILNVTPKGKRVRKWAGRVWAYDGARGRYRRVTGVARRPGILGRLRALWKRIQAEEGRA